MAVDFIWGMLFPARRKQTKTNNKTVANGSGKYLSQLHLLMLPVYLHDPGAASTNLLGQDTSITWSLILYQLIFKLYQLLDTWCYLYWYPSTWYYYYNYPLLDIPTPETPTPYMILSSCYC